MDAAHQADLARILQRRKEGGRLLDAGGTSGGGAVGATTTNNYNVAAAGANAQQQQIGRGDIVVERSDNFGSSSNNKSSNNAAASSGSGVYASASGLQQQPQQGSRPVQQNSAPLQGNAEIARILDELQRQRQQQQEEMRMLRSSIDDMSKRQQQLIQTVASPPRDGAAGANSGRPPIAGVAAPPPPPPPAGMFNSRPGKMIGAGAAGVRYADEENEDASSSKAKPTYLGATDQHRARIEQDAAASAAAAADPVQQKLLSDAAAMGLFVKPRSFVTTNGSRMITFNSPSRNEIGRQPTVNKSMFGRSSPNRGGANNTARATSPGAGRVSRGAVVADEPVGAGVGGGALVVPRAGESPMQVPRAPRNQPVPKPFSYSTFDVDSARVLLATGDWLYKLRVNINPQSITGPSGWDILNCVPRYVYLDTSTYMIKWGDKPGGSATIASHYVPIDHIVDVQIFASTESKATGGTVVMYYLVLNVVEGGFSARGRAAARRLCVFATELRDKADMWFEALKTVSGFYRAKSAATALTSRTFSSD